MNEVSVDIAYPRYETLNVTQLGQTVSKRGTSKREVRLRKKFKNRCIFEYYRLWI